MNDFTNRHKCRNDRAAVAAGACHNIGAGGVDNFCSTIVFLPLRGELACPSTKRQRQHAFRAVRALGFIVPSIKELK